MKTLRLFHLVVAAVGPFLLPITALSQGSLTPPGAPAPTMKKLDEIEPRTNLQASPAPAGVDAGNANYHFIITQPGSYYLSANLAVTKPNGIQINAEGVTLDLNGFQISRTGGTGNGIEIVVAAHRATIRNGSITGFAYGVNSLGTGGGSPVYARGCAFRDLSISGCSAYGILAGNLALIESCRAHDNNGTGAIWAANGAVMTNCTVDHNTTTYGIRAGAGSSLTNCAARENTGFTAISSTQSSTLVNCSAYTNFVAFGIEAQSGSSMTNCSAAFNDGGGATTSAGISAGNNSTVRGCTSDYNTTAIAPTSTTGMGFDIAAGSTIEHCTASANRGDNINVTSNCVVRENNTVAGAAGIHVLNSDNRIEGNNVTGAQRGIDIDAAGNYVVSNSASGNFAANYDIVAGNVFGAIVDRTAPGSGAVIGSSAPSSTGTTDPLANISY